jgi:hypothetical protein
MVYVHRKEAALKTVRTPDRLARVPNKPRTQHRSVRIKDSEWEDLETAADDFGLDRAKVINHLIDWWLRRPGAKLPERPTGERVAEIRREREER